MTSLILGEVSLTPFVLSNAVKTGKRVEISPAVWQRLQTARDAVDHIVERGEPVYGVNTGVGSQKDHAVNAQDVADYNRLLARAHGTRVPGPEANPDTVCSATIILAG